ncbi:MAG: CBS domain-containing protein [Acidobacteria bacterium]|nr:CBS domain-containing protein [Acidobacteriota bacterium]
MGEHNVSADRDPHREQAFMKSLLADLAALEQMIATDRIESGVRRIGAEQEMFLIDRAMRPSPLALEVLKIAADNRLTTEIGKFNLEANLAPRLLTGDGLRLMEQETKELVGLTRRAASSINSDVILSGILPTIRQGDLTLDNLVPNPRYFALNQAMQQLRGDAFNVHIKGLDELQLTHDNIMLEACCTSFQVHLQVGANEFVRLYNWAQAITAPLLALAANSPLFLGRRLWQETRIALFQHSTDERSNTRQLRSHPPRVSFGESWIKDSVIEVFREDIARFRILMTKDFDENPLEVLAQGQLPQLAALRLHNGTVWRWNRPCYGVSEGIAHLRIEQRALPAGPTVLDEMANAAFFFGLMTALPSEFGDVDRLMHFDDAKDNFFAAARHGLKAQLTWLNGHGVPVSALISENLLPLAQKGLAQAGVDAADISRYLNVIEQRVGRQQTGAMWALKSLSAMEGQGTSELRNRTLVERMVEFQQRDIPVAEWPLAKFFDSREWSSSYQSVGQLMATDLFTVCPDDLIDLAASVMDWKHVRHVPVEDDEGRILGLVSHRDLLRLLSSGLLTNQSQFVTVKEIMKRDPITVSPDTPTLEALNIMRVSKVGCLPVVENGKLVGIVTAYDFLALSAEIIEKQLKSILPDAE